MARKGFQTKGNPMDSMLRECTRFSIDPATRKRAPILIAWAIMVMSVPRSAKDPASQTYTKHVGCNQLPDFLIVSRQPQITLLTAGRLEFDRAREQDVIFEMNMPVQIVLKLFEPLEEGTIGRTGIFRRVKITAQTTDLGE